MPKPNNSMARQSEVLHVTTDAVLVGAAGGFATRGDHNGDPVDRERTCDGSVAVLS